MKSEVARLFWDAAREAASRLDMEPRELVTELGLLRVLANNVAGLGLARDQYREKLERLQHQLMQEQALHVSRTLDAAGIRHLFVRGMALIQQHYEPGEREMEDIDILTEACNPRAATAVLADAGFEPYPESEQSGPPALRATTTFFRARPRSDVDELDLDVHWGMESVGRLLPHRETAPASLFERRRMLDGLPVPHPADHLALTLHHLVHHDLLHVRGLFDAFLLWGEIGRGIDDTFLELVARFRVESVARRFLAFAARCMDTPAARGDTAGARIAPGIENLADWLVLAGGASEREYEAITMARFRRRLHLVDGRRVWLELFRDVIFPPEEFLNWRRPSVQGTLKARMWHLLRLPAKLK